MKKVLLFLSLFFITLTLTSCLNTNQTYEVTFMVNDEIYEVISFEEGSKLTLPNEPKVTDFAFKGWFYDPLFLDPLLEDTFISYDFTLTAKMVEVEKEDVYYTVSFYDGTTLFDQVDVKENDLLPNSIKTYKVGHIFEGWFLESGLSNVYSTQKVNSDINLYGKWVEGQSEYLAYYNGIQGLSGTALKNKLNEVISSGYKSIGYSSTSYIIEDSDKLTPSANTLWLIYNSGSANATWDSAKTWNKEHVWPRSKISVSIGESDIHNLRASNVGVNSSRGNMPFSDSSGNYGKAGNGWYPGDEHIGDVARIVLYMHVRYKMALSTSVIGDLQMFLDWHLEDPVSDFERNRNEVIYQNQKIETHLLTIQNSYHWYLTPKQDLQTIHLKILF